MLFPHKILLVVPDTKEPVITANQQRLVHDLALAGIPFVPLLNGVTVPDVINELKGGTYNIVMFLAHTFGTGVQLTPGSVLEPAALGAVARFGLQLVILLSCESYKIAQSVCEAADVDVIATIQPLDSGDAWRTGTLLIQALRDPSVKYEDAFLRSRPGEGADFVFIPARHRQERPKLDSAAEQTPTPVLTVDGLKEPVADSIARLNARIDAQNVKISHMDAKAASTLAALKRLDESMGIKFQLLEANLKAQTALLRGGGLRMTAEHRVVFSLAFLLLFTPIPLMLEPVQELLGFSWVAALLVAVSSYTLSAVMWSYMWWGGRTDDKE